MKLNMDFQQLMIKTLKNYYYEMNFVDPISELIKLTDKYTQYLIWSTKILSPSFFFLFYEKLYHHNLAKS